MPINAIHRRSIGRNKFFLEMPRMLSIFHAIKVIQMSSDRQSGHRSSSQKDRQRVAILYGIYFYIWRTFFSCISDMILC